jgi:hypothetical protein
VRGYNNALSIAFPIVQLSKRRVTRSIVDPETRVPYIRTGLRGRAKPRWGKYPMTDEQYRSLKLHLRVVIVLLGLMFIVLLTLCWAYISLPD